MQVANLGTLLQIQSARKNKNLSFFGNNISTKAATPKDAQSKAGARTKTGTADGDDDLFILFLGR